jgi:hypothetical protein
MVVLCRLCLLLFIAGIAAKSPPLWGRAAQGYALGVNFTSPEVNVSTWRFNMYYDATLNASMWQHLEGQHDYLCNKGSSLLTSRGAKCNAIHATNGWCFGIAQDFRKKHWK